MADPELRIETPSSVHSLGLLPDLMSGYLICWMREHFTDGNIQRDELKSHVYVENVSSPIEIDNLTHWKPGTTGKRPAVLISRNDWDILSLGIANRHMPGRVDNVINYTAFIQGTHTIFALSSLPTEAEMLGGEVYLEVLQFAEQVREELCLHRFRPVQLGKLFEIEEWRGNFAVPVTVMYGAEVNWKVMKTAPVLKTLKLSAMIP